MQLLCFLYKVYVLDQQINIKFRTHSLSLNDGKYGLYKISSKLGYRSEKLLACIRETSGHNLFRFTEYSDRRSSYFSSAYLANGQKIPRLRQYCFRKLIIHLLSML